MLYSKPFICLSVKTNVDVIFSVGFSLNNHIFFILIFPVGSSLYSPVLLFHFCLFCFKFCIFYILNKVSYLCYTFGTDRIKSMNLAHHFDQKTVVKVKQINPEYNNQPQWIFIIVSIYFLLKFRMTGWKDKQHVRGFPSSHSGTFIFRITAAYKTFYNHSDVAIPWDPRGNKIMKKHLGMILWASLEVSHSDFIWLHWVNMSHGPA